MQLPTCFENRPRPAYDPQPKRAPGLREPVTVHVRKPPVDALIRRHRHSWGQLVSPVRGCMRITAGDMTCIVPPLHAVWIGPCIDHELVMLGQVVFHVVYVEPQVSPLPSARCAMVGVSNLMRVLTEALGRAVDADGARYVLMMNLMLEEIRCGQSTPLGLRIPRDRRLRALCEALMDRPGIDWTLAQWARRVGASERTLARLFQAELQTGFRQWRQQLRLARSLALIKEGQPLAAIASELGYSSAAAFASVFKRTFALPPRQFAMADALARRAGDNAASPGRT